MPEKLVAVLTAVARHDCDELPGLKLVQVSPRLAGAYAEFVGKRANGGKGIPVFAGISHEPPECEFRAGGHAAVTDKRLWDAYNPE